MSISIIHFRKIDNPDFPRLFDGIPEAVMSGNKTILVPGGQMVHALEVILMPMIQDLVKESRRIRGIKKLPKKKKSGLLGIMDGSF